MVCVKRKYCGSNNDDRESDVRNKQARCNFYRGEQRCLANLRDCGSRSAPHPEEKCTFRLPQGFRR